ncbi:leucine-rich repeat protein, partial [Porcipelethomonas sp.]|uniref:leucine-rich repeat protein n=1 Tax=Porcipelethomonas sp. TaxID=2981675 RepID=UPI003EF6CE02
IYDYAVITGCNESAVSVDIPAEIDGLPVTEIDWFAFADCTNLKNVTIPDSVTRIGYEAFRDCSSLESVSIPDSVTSIGGEAFAGSGLKSIVIPDTVTDISGGTFYNCSDLESVVLPEGMTSVPTFNYGFFEDCESLTSVNIPDSVTVIYDRAFYGCSSLTGLVIPDNVTSIGREAFSGCSNLTELNVPENVTDIGYHAFYGTPWLENITDEYVVLGGGVFYQYNGNEDKIVLPDNVKYLSENAFDVYTATFSEITLSDNVESIDLSLFTEWERSAVVNLGKNTKEVSFWYDSKGNFYNVKAVNAPEDSLYFSSDDGILYNKDKTKLVYYPISKNDLTEYTIPDTVKEIGSGAFFLSNLSKITLPENLRKIGEMAFYCSGIDFGTLEIPDGVTLIKDSAFSGCNVLKVIVPESVIYIEGNAFAFCSDLTEIIFKNPECEIYDWYYTISNGDNENGKPYFSGTIYGYENSTAQEYAEKYGITFALLEDDPEITTVPVTTSVTTETTVKITSNVTAETSDTDSETTTEPVSTVTNISTVQTAAVTSGSISTAQTAETSDTDSKTTAEISKSSGTTVSTEISDDVSSANTTSVTESSETTPAVTETTSDDTVTLSKTKLDMSVGDKILLKLNGYSGETAWVSSNDNVAIVDSNGCVEAIGEGTATIFVTYGEKGEKNLSCSVTVEGGEVKILGDANGDGVMNVRDAAFIAKMLAQGKNSELPMTADYNGDGVVNVRDAASIARTLANTLKQTND